MTVEKTTIADNQALTAGGLLNDGTVGQAYAALRNSTLSGNSAVGEPSDSEYDHAGGGAILNNNGARNPYQTYTGTATVDLINCTLSGNSTNRAGGAIANHGAATFFPTLLSRVSLNSCTLSGNAAALGGNSIWNKANVTVPCIPDPEPCNDPVPGVAIVDFAHTIFNVGAALENILNISPGTITSRGYNLSSDAAGGDGSISPGGFLNAIGDIRNLDPRLGPLQDNGGPTLTHALLLGSMAIDAGNPSFDPNAFTPPLIYDQRSGPGFPRLVNGRIDIGAFESRHP